MVNIVYLYLELFGRLYSWKTDQAAAVIHRYDAWDCKASKSVCKSRKDVNRFMSRVIPLPHFMMVIASL